jgi:hypothetical protein
MIMSFWKHFKSFKHWLQCLCMFLRTFYSLLNSFQIISHVSIIYLKNCHVKTLKTCNISRNFDTKMWKINVSVTLVVAPINMIAPKMHLVLSKRFFYLKLHWKIVNMHIAIVPNLVIFYCTLHNILIGCFGIDVDQIVNMLQ